MRFSKRLLHGKQLQWTALKEYELTVEHSFFGMFPRIQIYRGHVLWQAYPQGYSYWGDTDWLYAQCQQYEWSKESRNA